MNERMNEEWLPYIVLTWSSEVAQPPGCVNQSKWVCYYNNPWGIRDWPVGLSDQRHTDCLGIGLVQSLREAVGHMRPNRSLESCISGVSDCADGTGKWKSQLVDCLEHWFSALEDGDTLASSSPKPCHQLLNQRERCDEAAVPVMLCEGELWNHCVIGTVLWPCCAPDGGLQSPTTKKSVVLGFFPKRCVDILFLDLVIMWRSGEF